MARRKDDTAAQRKKHSELQGRGKGEGITNIKKASRMPARKGKETMMQFFVAEGVRMGHPNMGHTQADPAEVRIAEAGDPIQLTKPQAEWCMANGFIDSVLPDFDPAPVTHKSDVPNVLAGVGTPEGEAAVGGEDDGQGELPLDGGDAGGSVPEAPKRAPQRKAAKL